MKREEREAEGARRDGDALRDGVAPRSGKPRDDGAPPADKPRDDGASRGADALRTADEPRNGSGPHADERRSKSHDDEGRASDLPSSIRRINAVLALALGAFFLAHEAFGALAAGDASAAVRGIVWACAGAAAAHAMLCVATSYWMLSDTVRPASARKRRHLALKWVSGAVLATLVAAHVAGRGVLDAPQQDAVAALLACALAWHLFVGAKSALRDVGAKRRWRTPLRIVVCVATALILLALALA